MVAASWHVFVQLAPWLLFGTAIAALLHRLLPEGLIHRRLQGRSGVVQAVLLGVPLPLCSCGVIPAGVGLKRDGASDGASVGFLISTPQTGVDSVLVSASFLGWPFALFKVLSAAAMGMIGGFLTEASSSRAGADSVNASAEVAIGPRTWRSALEHGTEVVRSIWVWLLIGVLVSAAIEIYVPPSVFEQIGAWGSLPSALTALVISLPLYVCAVASVPIAGAMVANGLPAGAGLVFLMAGPASNVATMGAIYRAFGGRVLSIYLATIVVGSLGSAMAFDWLLPDQVSIADHAFHEHGSGLLSQLSAVGLLVLFAWFAWQDASHWWRRRGSAEPAAGSSIRISVEGMSCSNCVQRLESALQSTQGVSWARVQLEPGEAVVQGTIDEAQLCEKIRETGFVPAEVQKV